MYSDISTTFTSIFEMGKLERLTHLNEVTQLVNHRAKDLSSASSDSRPLFHMISLKNPRPTAQ